jgi:hypothetical protein
MTSIPEGGCTSSKLRYRCFGSDVCRDCQRQTGSAFVLNALIETDRVELLSGETQAIEVPIDSGRPHAIYRCAACKVASGVTTAAFRNSASRAHIHTRSKLPWGRPARRPSFRGLPRFEETLAA